MPGPIFLHCQTYARKPSRGGNSLAQVIGEALRDPKFSVHVDAPKAPRTLFGNPVGFRAEHDAHVAARATSVQTTKGVVQRSIRVDRHTLATIVASYPLSFAQIKAGGAEAAEHHAAWERETVAWVQAQYGDQLRVVIAHDDEAHPHLHFWLLTDDPGADATTLHPGKVAKRIAEAQAKAEGHEARAAVRAGNAALKAAMRNWLDAYYLEVGVPLGMTRDGPKLRRLSRSEWQAEKARAAREAELHRRQEHQRAATEAMVAKGHKTIDAVMAKADAAAERLAADRKAFQAEREAQAVELASLDADRAQFAREKEKLDRDQNQIMQEQEAIARGRVANAVEIPWRRAPGI